MGRGRFPTDYNETHFYGPKISNFFLLPSFSHAFFFAGIHWHSWETTVQRPNPPLSLGDYCYWREGGSNDSNRTPLLMCQALVALPLFSPSPKRRLWGVSFSFPLSPDAQVNCICHTSGTFGTFRAWRRKDASLMYIWRHSPFDRREQGGALFKYVRLLLEELDESRSLNDFFCPWVIDTKAARKRNLFRITVVRQFSLKYRKSRWVFVLVSAYGHKSIARVEFHVATAAS